VEIKREHVQRHRHRMVEQHVVVLIVKFVIHNHVQLQLLMVVGPIGVLSHYTRVLTYLALPCEQLYL
jgi:hypothetical protein